MKNIVISGGFKTGTHSLYGMISCNIYNCTVYRTHLLPHEYNEPFDIMYIPFRSNNDNTYISGLFQNIIDTQYEYSPFTKPHFLSYHYEKSISEKKNIIMECNIIDLYNHYNKIDWNKYIHLNNNLRKRTINENFGININNDDIQVFNIENKNYHNGKLVKLIVVKTEKLSEHEYVTKLLQYIDPEFNRKDIIGLEGYNKASEKWYSKKYKEFKEYYNTNA